MKFCAILVGMFMAAQICSAKIVDRSASKQPEWVKKGEAKLNKDRSNTSYYFKVIENTGRNLENLRDGRVLALSQYVGSTNHISGSMEATIEETTTNKGVDSRETYEMRFTNQIGTSTFHAKVVDEYWELHSDGGNRYYKYYALFAVSSSTAQPQYDQFSTTTSYGGGAFARSIIPGWGQIYKGSPGKGVTFMALEAMSVASIILSESNRSVYKGKAISQPKHAKEYNNRASNWATVRNISIGVAGAVYVWNLVDALAAKGARRVIVKKSTSDLSIYPSISPNHAGIGLTYNF